MKPSQTLQYVANPEVTSIQGRSFVQQRLHHFGLTLMVMGASFFLYYLGFFGGVDGPLQPERIGERMAITGCSKVHVMILLSLLTVLAIIWNWIYNAVNRLLGRRRVCIYHSKKDGVPCGLPVTRQKGLEKAPQYVCRDGHASGKAFFISVKKGTVGHFVWMLCMVLTLIVLYHMG